MSGSAVADSSGLGTIEIKAMKDQGYDPGFSAAITAAYWQQWSINLSDFVGVDLTAIKKMSIGIGDKESTEPGGSGIIYIDDIQLHHPLQQ